MAHPTKSASRYQQMIGRSTRPLPGVVDGQDLDTPEKRRAAIAASPKPFCRIIDPVGNCGKHRLVTCMDILGGKVSDRARSVAIKKAIKEGKPVRVSRVLDQAEIQLREEQRKRTEAHRQQEAARRASLVPKSKFSMVNVDPFSNSHTTKAMPLRMRTIDLPTDRQINFLRCRGINPAGKNKRQCGAIIGSIKQREEKRRAAG